MTVRNADAQELAKFDASASRWWDLEGEFKPLHDINPLRLDYIESRCGPVAGRRVLDAGCGGGILSEGLAARGAQVTAIDLAEGALATARLHGLESGLTVDYRLISIEELLEQGEAPFDVVCCLEMLEHVPDPASVVSACARLVKPDGHVVLSTLNRTPKAYAMAVLGAEYLLRLLPMGTHDYGRFIRPSELASWARHSGLALKHLTGMHYNPITRSYRLADGVDVNYLCHLQPAP